MLKVCDPSPTSVQLSMRNALVQLPQDCGKGPCAVAACWSVWLQQGAIAFLLPSTWYASKKLVLVPQSSHKASAHHVKQ